MVAGAEEENSSGPDDPMPYRSKALDYPVPATSAVRSSTDTSVLRERLNDPTPYAEKGLTTLNG